MMDRARPWQGNSKNGFQSDAYRLGLWWTTPSDATPAVRLLHMHCAKKYSHNGKQPQIYAHLGDSESMRSEMTSWRAAAKWCASDGWPPSSLRLLSRRRRSMPATAPTLWLLPLQQWDQLTWLRSCCRSVLSS